MDVINAKLGIDLGTTSVKISLVNSASREILYSFSKSSDARVTGVEVPPLSDEQDVPQIFRTIQSCLEQLTRFYSDSGFLYKLNSIGITGQMHGVVFWKSGLKIEDILKPRQRGSNSSSDDQFSNLFTWQDGRCSPDFLANLPSPESHLRLSTGHGCATMFWFLRNSPDFLQRFDRAGTIMDLLVTMLCGLDNPVMSTQNAASWGYFNCKTSSWNSQILSQFGFPVHLLPAVREPGTIAGQTKESRWCGGILPDGVDVGVGLGDLPCTILPVLQSPSDAVISISTSAQVVTTSPAGFTPPQLNSSHPSPIEYFPYFDGTFLAVAAALTGGNILAHLVTTLQSWLLELDLPQASDRDQVFTKLIQLGLKCKDTTLEIDPILGGERHQPDRRGTISNADFDNLSLGSIFRATCRGIAKNLSTMSPPDEMVAKGVARVVGCGSALLRNPVLKEEIEKVFEGLAFVYSDQGDASLGAALAMHRN